MAKRGIDISAHQGDINLSALSDQIDFVIIRVGFGVKGTLDTKFKRNVELCEKLKLPYGFYWYSYALDTNGASQEAAYFLKAIAPYNPTYGCWFDMEDADGYKKRNGMPSNATLQDICYEFCQKVQDAGYYTGIYASQFWFNNRLAGNKLNKFDKWVAQWPTSGGKQRGLNVSSKERTDWNLWQFTSDGKFNGYSGRLDTNYAYKDFLNPKSQPEPVTTPNYAPEGSVLELAVNVLQGKYGDGDARKTSLGTRYEEVQDLINHIAVASIDVLVKEVKEGKYGNGDTRKIVLGDKYEAVQKQINKKPTLKKEIVKGSKIRFTGSHSYSGLRLASWTHNDVFDVIEVSGDRVVIGKGTAVTSAVNIKDCKLV